MDKSDRSDKSDGVGWMGWMEGWEGVDGVDGVERAAGFTLVELVVVVALLALVAGVVVVRCDDLLQCARVRAAGRDLQTLREAFLGGGVLPGYLPDMEKLPGFSAAGLRLHNLLGPTNVVGRGGYWLDQERERRGYAAFAAFTNWNSELERGWRGPYVRVNAYPSNLRSASKGFYPAPDDRRYEDDETFAARGFAPRLPPSMRRLPSGATPYALPGDLAMADPWGNPYVLQVPPAEAFDAPTDALRFHYARLVSAGPDGVLQTPCFDFEAPPYHRPRRRWRRWRNASPPRFNYAALTPAEKRLIRLAGVEEDGSASLRGDDLVIFINRTDIYAQDE